MMEDIYLAIEVEQPAYAAKIQQTSRRKKAADHFPMLVEQQEAKQQWALQFDQLIDTWNEPIFLALNQLAQLRWPPDRVLGFIPVSAYRLRDEQVGDIHLWWVEHDMPPQGNYQCAAYQVCLIFNKQGRAALTVQSGTRAYPISPPTVDNLKATVAKAGQDPPLIISRSMGKIKA